MWSLRRPSVWMTALAVLVAMGPGRPLPAQGIEAEELSAETLRRDVRFLQMLSNLSVTAGQRAQAAAAIEAFQEKRAAAEKLSEPPELLTALSAVRAALLKGEAPTAAMREAVEAARPPDDGAVDRTLAEARSEALTALGAVLTDQQKEQLGILPLIGVAEDVIAMCMESRRAPDEEAQAMRLRDFGEVRDQLASAAGDDADRVLGDFQSLINRIAALSPEQVEPQRQQLVGQIVTLLKTTFDKQPDLAAERLGDQLWGWLAEPRVGELFRESAEAMGAQ